MGTVDFPTLHLTEENAKSRFEPPDEASREAAEVLGGPGVSEARPSRSNTPSQLITLEKKDY